MGKVTDILPRIFYLVVHRGNSATQVLVLRLMQNRKYGDETSFSESNVAKKYYSEVGWGVPKPNYFNPFNKTASCRQLPLAMAKLLPSGEEA
jgi:hypothetical protein